MQFIVALAKLYGGREGSADAAGRSRPRGLERPAARPLVAWPRGHERPAASADPSRPP